MCRKSQLLRLVSQVSLFPSLLALGCSRNGPIESLAIADVPEGTQPKAVSTSAKMTLLSFDGPTPPRNKAGDGYPCPYPNVPGGGGHFTTSINSTDAISGNSLQLHWIKDLLNCQFNAHNPDGTRGFAREYCADPGKWRFNTYNRMRFWIKAPSNGPEMPVNGMTRYDIGTYVKRVANSDSRSDEAGGNHYYHIFNLPPVGEWTQVILNMHPHHRRGNSGNMEVGYLPHPTGEENYTYFDALTRFYLTSYDAPTSYPADYLLDEFEFYEEPNSENDQQVYALTGTYVPSSKRIIVTWSRNKDEDNVKHEVRFAFDSIHKIGWDTAMVAPQGEPLQGAYGPIEVKNGVVSPPGGGGYNGMIYATRALPLGGKSLVYIAIRPQNSKLFTQIAIPLSQTKKGQESK